MVRTAEEQVPPCEAGGQSRAGESEKECKARWQEWLEPGIDTTEWGWEKEELVVEEETKQING